MKKTLILTTLLLSLVFLSSCTQRKCDKLLDEHRDLIQQMGHYERSDARYHELYAESRQIVEEGQALDCDCFMHRAPCD